MLGGGLAASAAEPGWIATADLTLHLVGAARPGSVVEARAEVLRAGRTTVVIEVALVDEDDRNIGIATMSFAVLARRETNPEIGSIRHSSSTMATTESRLRQHLLDELGVVVQDTHRGVIDVPVIEWSLNSMGAMQGGVVATVAEVAAEHALRAATGEAVVVTDLYVAYLGFGKIGPVRSAVEILGTAPGHGAARVELVDSGADDRLMTVVHAVATRGLT